MNPSLTDITIVLDRSGSMASIRTDTIGGMNSFVDEQRKAPGSANLTLVQFDTEYEVVHKAIPVGQFPLLTEETFVPRGGTALLDAMGRAINETGARLGAMAEADRPGKVVFVVFTDGEENRSQEFDTAKVKELTTHQQEKYGWQFVYLGANQDSFAVAARLGVNSANVMSFAACNISEVSSTTSRKLASYRSGNPDALVYTSAERSEAMDVSGGKKA